MKRYLFLILFLLIGVPAEAQRGCCSWHGGVSHCDVSVGRKVCNDGTYSPSCTCGSQGSYSYSNQDAIQRKYYECYQEYVDAQRVQNTFGMLQAQRCMDNPSAYMY